MSDEASELVFQCMAMTQEQIKTKLKATINMGISFILNFLTEQKFEEKKYVGYNTDNHRDNADSTIYDEIITLESQNEILSMHTDKHKHENTRYKLRLLNTN